MFGLDEGKEGQYVKITTHLSRNIFALLKELTREHSKGEKGD